MIASASRLPQIARLNRRVRLPLLVGLCLAGILAAAALGILASTPRISLAGLWDVLRGGGTPLDRVLITELRVPRFVLGALGGAMLALSGALLQDAMRNPLAGPELLGVTAGATIVVAAITILHLSVLLVLIPWLALAGGLLAGGLVIILMRRTDDPIRLVLVGAALTALLNAAVIVLMSYGTQSDIGVLFLFLVGSLANRTWIQVQLILPWALLGIPLALLTARALNVLQLGEDVARGLGLPVLRVRVLVLVLSAALVAAVVAVSGPIAFVALLAPHLVRRALDTSDARVVLPCCALVGAALLTGADVLARLTFDPLELPVGIWTTLLGGPLLLLLLRRHLRASRGDA